ncbi:ABC transporter substrate-binding protein [Lacisediminihabitans profunda]|uniref:ABC transporter substrate-binding protein n=1 Tax=Lacisediminihabitans profunda TaxID=2594790 RepID=A0A5C8UPM8_9MICO|nr:ABC transporter substrate-binding protein [Lacisediminihabitans profunda]TXN30249.1 ABC transporter substrate-binding protein [Lacisediminihabitans profunda]
MSVLAKATASRSRSLKSAVSGIAILGISALILSGCASGGSTSSGKDLTLKIGTILPQTGSLAVLGPPEFAGVAAAAADINAAKAGIKVTVENKDSGDTKTNIATQSATALLADGVSAIIGAASSSVSLSIIDQITKAKVIEISPANTSPTFSSYADDGYYWRTAPSDVLQGRVLGQKVLKDGATNVSIIYQNDSYGQGLDDNAKKAIEAGGGKVGENVPYDPAATSFSSEVTQALSTNPDALIVISFDQLKAIAPELQKNNFDFKKFYGTDGNYGVIDKTYTGPDIAGAQFTVPGVDASKDFQAKLQALVKKEGNAALTVFTYAPESYDATVLLALAALKGKKADGPTIKANLETVSKDGTKCTTFAACAKLINDGKAANYDGLSGPITFDKNGDPSQAYISIYKYTTGNDNVYESAEFGDLTK